MSAPQYGDKAGGYPPPAYPAGGQPGYPAGGQTGYPAGGQPTHAAYAVDPAQPGTTVVVQQAYVNRPENYLILSVLTCLCCNIICGGIALIYSLNSSSAADRGDMETARQNGRTARNCSIAGIVISVILTIIMIIIYFTVLAVQVHHYG